MCRWRSGAGDLDAESARRGDPEAGDAGADAGGGGEGVGVAQSGEAGGGEADDAVGGEVDDGPAAGRIDEANVPEAARRNSHRCGRAS
jgi:hypothetical protein